MKTKNMLGYIFGFIAALSVAVSADLTTVTVPVTSLHGPYGAMGLGCSGRVDYTLSPTAAYDSVFVSLAIVPVGGGNALALSEVSGDIGKILVNVNKPNVAKTYSIFFQVANPVAGQQYVASITANAVKTVMSTSVDSLLALMSKTQRATICTPAGYMSNQGAGPIPGVLMSDGPNGVRVGSFGSGNSTCFPTDAGIACTWDTAIAFKLGQAKGEEFRGYGRNCQLGPAFDLVYHCQGGRASEYYGEDPVESGTMAAADVLGCQTRGMIATIKHYACNNKEQNRTSLSANMDERSLREIYLKNWKPAVVNSHCLAIMGAYNKVNNSYACSNRYIMSTVLRDEWGDQYFVMTDWGAGFDNFTAGITYGVDMQTNSATVYTTNAIAALSDSQINVHARRIINSCYKIGNTVPGYNPTAYASLLMGAAHKAITLTAGDQGIILARDSVKYGSPVLPIPPKGVKICLMGPFANTCRTGPGGSSAVTPTTANSITPTMGITSFLTKVGAGASTIVTDSSTADYLIVFVGVTGETEGSDRPNLSVQGGDGDNAAANALAQAAKDTTKHQRVITVFTGGSAATPGNWSKAPGVLIAFYPGEQQGNSMADILFGKVNPSGKLPVTFPATSAQLPNFTLVNNNLQYPRCDSAHGYFRVNKMNQEPLFNFGHGLSYTTFSYSNLLIYPTTISAGDRVKVQVTVTNAGTVPGKEVVQLYLSMPTTNAAFPVRVQDLRAFCKVPTDSTFLQPGASVTVNFTVSPEDMQLYNNGGTDYSGTGGWTILSGTYGVRVGTSSQRTMQPSLSGSFTVQ